MEFPCWLTGHEWKEGMVNGYEYASYLVFKHCSKCGKFVAYHIPREIWYQLPIASVACNFIDKIHKLGKYEKYRIEGKANSLSDISDAIPAFGIITQTEK